IREGPQNHVPYQYAPDEIIIKFRETAADAIAGQLGLKKSASGLRLSRNLDDLAAKYRMKVIRPVFKDFKKHRQRMEALSKKDTRLLTKKEKHILRRLKRSPKGATVPDLSKIYKIKLDLEPGQPLEEVVAAYNADPDVEYAELNYIVSIDLTPNDPLYPIQWSLYNTGQMYPESGRFNPPPGTPDCDIDAPEAWDMETGSSEIIVAVVDTGVDYRHRDLQASMWTDANGHYGYDFHNKDNNPMDDHGHGTHCAGTIAARGDNGLDIAGVCWHARIMAVKFLDSTGSGYMDDGLAALYYAVANGADVTSNSWGSFFDYAPMEETIGYAHSQGVITVAAAGNGYSTYPHYPAYYEHVISVAATDSDDQKASFSTYGDWVDIAAPGVDILSLRAGGTAMGTTYDAYTTIGSGTSMACPHVAGACALLLSADPALTNDQIYDILMETVDPIAPEICISGRINLFGALLEVILPKGRIKLDADYYGCSDQVGARLNDLDLVGEGSHAVTLTTDRGDSETVVLTEAVPGSFTGSIPTGSGDPNSEDGAVQVVHGEAVTATYYDADDGTGSPATEQDWATIDCELPSIFNIRVNVPGPEPTVSFETNEPTSARVLYGTACGPPYTTEDSDLSLRTSHTIRLTGVSPETDYFFVVEAADRAGNTSDDSNEGECYAFTSTGPNDVINVPDEAATIQQAIDICWEGGTVVVAEGTYTGSGNRDISFWGKAITVRSTNPDEPSVVAATVIDCNGTEAEPHRGFYFENDEGRDSVLSGFTIINGYEEYGGAICCDSSRPTISNCTITGNAAWEAGGIGNYYFCSPAIINCTITGNTAGQQGAGLCRCDGLIVNCTITGNRAKRHGGGVSRCNGPIVNCTITGNRAGVGAGGLHWCHGLITHCIIWDNQMATSSAPLYSCVKGGSSGTGCISSDPCFVTPGYWEGDIWVEGDYRLSAESLCIDAGNYYYMTLPLTDCRGNLRLAGEQIDMGCYEFGSSPDTDGDLLADSSESSFENDPDRDNDGMLDGVEVLRGTDPDVFDPLGQWNVPADADTIQEALFFSRHGEIITLSEGTYRENIYIVDRNIILTSTDPSDAGVVTATIINGDTDADPQTGNGRVITLARTDETACDIRGLTITGGNAHGSHGGGISGSAGITNCVITGNRASYNGGGISSCRGSIVDCMIIDNVAASRYGGGLRSCYGPIVNCTITGNSAGDDGGGMAWCEGPITNCTITDNSSGD
ncbi:MAG: S8 family serine peptidase, partial [Planctomycetota bacterium]